jgi:hypothetical protein
MIKSLRPILLVFILFFGSTLSSNTLNKSTIDTLKPKSNNYIIHTEYVDSDFGIDKAKLPKNSKIINKPYSLYENYKNILFKLIAIFSVILVLFLIFLLYLKRVDKNNNDMIVISIIRFSPIFVIPIVTSVIVWFFMLFANQNLEQKIEIKKKAYIQNKKLELKREVDRFVQIAQHRLNSKNATQKKIKSNLLSIASSIRYGKSGYIIVGSMEGRMLEHPNKDLVGISFYDPKYIKAKKVFELFEQKIDENGEGFVT